MRRGTYVVRGIRVVVHATEERCRRIASDVLDKQMTATGMFFQEVRDVMDEAGDDDKRTLGTLLLD